MKTWKQQLKKWIYHIDNNFFFTVIRHALTMMIPFILTGGIACAFMNFPMLDYSTFMNGNFMWLYQVFKAVYQGTFGLFSLVLGIALAISYGMERNEPTDKVAMYVVVTLGAYGTHLSIARDTFPVQNMGASGSFSAMVIAIFSCYFYEKLKKRSTLTLRKYAIGMDSICSDAVQTLLPMAIIICAVVVFSRAVYTGFGVFDFNDVFSGILCDVFNRIDNDFLEGLVYTFFVHIFWICGFHGGHMLEPVARMNFAEVSSDTVFSKSFFDTYVGMGGCGTTICVLLLLLIFYRKNRIGNLAKLGAFTVIFNINEILNFGLPIILNPIMAIPFILTPVLCYCVTYGVTYLGIVPMFCREVSWSVPPIINGYLATGSIRGAIVQVICIILGMGLYYPFIRLHKNMQELYAQEKLKIIVEELKKNEEENEAPQFLTRADSVGLISRMLLEDLKLAIKQDKLYMLYQPQVDEKGICIGAEALLRWQHPLYGFIYPPLIIYLAKEGGVLQELEERVFDMATRAIREVSKSYDEDFKISVNITAKSLLWDIESCIRSCLAKYDVPAERLWVEITEQDVISNAEYVIEKLKRLKRYGHMLLIDDFGMGHTSLIYLQSNYFGVVKLDGSLVRRIVENKTNQKIVASIVELGNELGVRVIAEYVENREQRALLEQLGCCWYQGYLFSKPVELEQFISYIKSCNKKQIKKKEKGKLQVKGE